MEFVCVERLGNEDEYEGYQSYDYNLYLLIEDQWEEFEMRKYLIELKKRFKFLRNAGRTELCVFLPDSTKQKAIEFSDKLKQKLKSAPITEIPKPEKFHKILVDDYDPRLVASVRARNGSEEIVVYEIDKNHQIHYIHTVNATKHTITKLKKLLKGEDDGQSEEGIS